MPTYTFYNTKTKEESDIFLSISEYDHYLNSNPHMVRQYNTPPAISGDSVGLGLRKNDGGFNDLMHRIGKANPGSAVADKYVSRSNKQVKVDSVAKKHGLRKGGS